MVAIAKAVARRRTVPHPEVLLKAPLKAPLENRLEAPLKVPQGGWLLATHLEALVKAHLEAPLESRLEAHLEFLEAPLESRLEAHLESHLEALQRVLLKSRLGAPLESLAARPEALKARPGKSAQDPLSHEALLST